MIRSTIFALALCAGVSSAAQAQQAKVVSTCGASQDATRVGDSAGMTRDLFGNWCVSGGAGQAAAASPAIGGVSGFSRIPSSAAGTNLTAAKSGASRAYTYHGCNTTASTIYMRIYNAASTGAVTVGTTAPFAGPYAFPANTCLQATTFAADIGISVSAGLVYAFTTTPMDNDATAIGAGAITAFQIGFQ